MVQQHRAGQLLKYLLSYCYDLDSLVTKTLFTLALTETLEDNTTHETRKHSSRMHIARLPTVSVLVAVLGVRYLRYLAPPPDTHPSGIPTAPLWYTSSPNRMTHVCENIAFTQLLLWAVLTSGGSKGALRTHLLSPNSFNFNQFFGNFVFQIIDWLTPSWAWRSQSGKS